MPRILIYTLGLFFCYISQTSADEWNFVVNDTSCFVWKGGKAKLSDSKGVNYIVSFGYSSNKHVISGEPLLAGLKKQQYTLTIAGHVVELDQNKVDIYGTDYKAPFDISIANTELKLNFKDKDTMNWSYFIQGKVVERIMENNLQSKYLEFLIGLKNTNNYANASMTNEGFTIKAHLLKQCEAYFV